jgi:pimeloyl-ACP methyl ester carboxylesterase
MQRTYARNPTEDPHRRNGARPATIVWRAWFALLAMVSLACSSSVQQSSVRFGRAPATYVRGLGACSEDPHAILYVDPDQPVVLLVHGCNASAGKFRNLAQVFEAHGQQTACFSYDDRDSMDESSGELRRAIEALTRHMRAKQITVLGHSQGGLLSRRALIRERSDGVLEPNGFTFRLVTVSSPFGGIRASKHCGLLALHILTFGISAGVCQIAAGSKWMQIHPYSWFVEQPGTLVEQVADFLKVVTDERDTCLVGDERGQCRESDYVFSLDEQLNSAIDGDPRVVSQTVKSGHSAIVGQDGLAPRALIHLLQDRGVMLHTPPSRVAAVERLLTRLY